MQPAWYALVDNHSWHNLDRCDAHGMCWSCLQRYVELKILDEGLWNLRCPGEGCRYRLVGEDIKLILSQSPLREKALQTYESVRSDTGTTRLREVLSLAVSAPSETWVLHELQACPRCLVLARREDGCFHLVCRCSCDFCFGCGAPYQLKPHENIGCFCGEDEDEEEVQQASLGAWLARTNLYPCLESSLRKLYPRSRAQSHIALLRQAREVVRLELELRHTHATLGSWLYSAGADVGPPQALPSDDAQEEHEYLQQLFVFESSDNLPSELEAELEEENADDAFAFARRAKHNTHGEPRKVSRLSPKLLDLSCSPRCNRANASYAAEVSATPEKAKEMRQRQRLAARRAKATFSFE